MVLAATLLPQGGAAAGPAVMRYLNRAATLGDPWAALLLAARHWEGGCAGDQQRSHSQATRLVQVAAEAVEAAGERQATVQGTVAAAVAAPERGFLLHCTGGMCQLSPQDTASAAAASLPWPLAARQRLVGQPVLPGAAALLGSYEAVAGSEAGWRDLQVGQRFLCGRRLLNPGAKCGPDKPHRWVHTPSARDYANCILSERPCCTNVLRSS